MILKFPHRWNVSLKQAADIQRELAKHVILTDQMDSLDYVAGCDLAIQTERNWGFAGVILYRWNTMEEVERKVADGRLTFPYVPGFLSFREGPILLKAISKLKHKPDLFVFDGQGIAHPRGFGIATHLGVLLNKPTIGCAKSRLIGSFKEPASKAGSDSPLLSGKGKIMGFVVRTRDDVKPIFVSPGHRVSPRTAVRLILRCCDGYRIPKPTREADHYVEDRKRSSRRR